MKKKMVSCSKCYAPVDIKSTRIMDGLRICHKCHSVHDEKLKKAFAMYTGGAK